MRTLGVLFIRDHILLNRVTNVVHYVRHELQARVPGDDAIGQ